MEPQEEFTALMERVNAGSQEAAREFVDKYGPHILRVVRRRLGRKMRSKFDSADFVQSVWASFFAIPRTDARFTTPDGLVNYLVNVTRNKLIDAFRQRRRAKFDVFRENSLNGSAALEAAAVHSVQPTPSQVAGAREKYEKLVEKLPTHQRIILEFLRQGYTHEEIAARIGVDEKTIRRLIRRIAPGLLPNESPEQPSPG